MTAMMVAMNPGDRIVVTRHDEAGDPPVGWQGTVTNVDRGRYPIRVDWHPPGWDDPGWWLSLDQVVLTSDWAPSATQEQLAQTHALGWRLLLDEVST